MSDGPPPDPNRKPLPWEPGAQPVPGPADPTVAWTPPDAPEPPPPLATPGLISAAPVGWTGQDIGSGPTPGAPPPPVVGWIQPPPATAIEVQGLGPAWQISGMWPRFWAYVFDGFALFLVAVVASFAIGGYDMTLATGDRASRVLGSGLVILVVDALYYVLFWRSPGQATPGMRLLGLRVVRQYDGKTLSVDAAIIRWVALGGVAAVLALLPLPGQVGAYLGPLWLLTLLLSAATHPLRQGLHDRWANSVVARRVGAGYRGAVAGCLLVIVVGTLIPIIVGAAMTDELRDILEEIGRSV